MCIFFNLYAYILAGLFRIVDSKVRCKYETLAILIIITFIIPCVYFIFEPPALCFYNVHAYATLIDDGKESTKVSWQPKRRHKS